MARKRSSKARNEIAGLGLAKKARGKQGCAGRRSQAPFAKVVPAAG